MAIAWLMCLIAAGGLHWPGDTFEPMTGAAASDYIRFGHAGPNDEMLPVEVNGWWGLINTRGVLVVYPQYVWTDASYEALARAVVDGRTGFLRGNGSWQIEPTWAYADRFAEGVALVGDGVRYGFMEKTGRLRTELAFDAALRFSDGMAAVMRDGRVGYINVRGRVAIPLQYAQATSFRDGVAAVREMDGDRPGRFGFIDKRGAVLWTDRTGEVEDLRAFREGLARVKIGGKWGYMDRSFAGRIEPRFDDARDFIGGTAAVRLDEQWGFIDKLGRFEIEPEYDWADSSEATLSPVGRDEQYGFVGRTGRFEIEPQYVWVWPFFRGWARVGIDDAGRFMYVNGANQSLWRPGRAEQGFVDVRARERARVAHDWRVVGNRIIAAPPRRPRMPAPYPPEHLYEGVLPGAWRER